MATGEFIAMLDNDDTIHPDALLEVARALFANADIDVIYTDEDKIDEQGRLIDTYHKPDWSPEHLESVMYVLHMLVVRKKLFLELGGFRAEYSGAQDYDLMLRLSRRTQKVHHIARALYHWRAVQGSAASVVDAKPYALQAGFRALQDHVAQKHGDRAWVEDGLLPGTFRVRRKILGRPRVSLLILTNNGELDLPGRGCFHMVDNLVDSILRRTSYRNYEILVVDNSKLSKEQIARFRTLGVRVENFTGPVVPFNYAAKANFALRVCRTENLVLLNDDMEVINEDWLTSLLELSQDPEVGAVGARLLHADGTIQHVGCVIGVNNGTAHVYHSFPGDFIGYNGFTHLIRNYSAVTGACFATRKSVMSQVGGLDESFAIDFNDTDLCLKILESGYRIVYTPYSSLFHFEGASAKRVTQNADERRRFVARWARYMENDPYFNPNFSRSRFDFTVA
jgi:GT2 family glycosyltransferase